MSSSYDEISMGDSRLRQGLALPSVPSLIAFLLNCTSALIKQRRIATTSKHREIAPNLIASCSSRGVSSRYDTLLRRTSVSATHSQSSILFGLSILAEWRLEPSTRRSSFYLVNRFGFVEVVRTECDEETCEPTCAHSIATLSRLCVLS